MDAAQIPSTETFTGIATICEDQDVDSMNQHVVDFDGPEDPEDPLNWSAKYKWSVVILISIMSLVV